MQEKQFHLHSQLEETHWWFTGRREIVRRLIRQTLPPIGRPLVVDIGCGTGGNLAALSEGYDCVGWDPSEEGIRLARQRFPRTRFLTGSLEEALAGLPRPADLLLLMDVLEHIEEDSPFFSRLTAAIRPGGYALITVPAGMELWSPHDVSFGHFRRYNRRQLEQLWEGRPFRPLLLSYYNTRLYPLVRGIRLFTRWRGQAVGEARTDLGLPRAPINRLLTRIFSGESGFLARQLKEGQAGGFRRGVSLIALLQKEGGTSNGA